MSPAVARCKRDVVDAALFVLVALERLDRVLRRLDAARQCQRELAAQIDLALLGDEALFGVAALADQLVEPRAVELAGDAVERRIVGDALGQFGVGDVEPKLLRALVERGFGDQLPEQLPVEADRACLCGVTGRPTWRLSCCSRSLNIWRNWSTGISRRANDGDRRARRSRGRCRRCPRCRSSRSGPAPPPMTALPSQFEEAFRIPRSILRQPVDEISESRGSSPSRDAAHHRDRVKVPQLALNRRESGVWRAREKALSALSGRAGLCYPAAQDNKTGPR